MSMQHRFRSLPRATALLAAALAAMLAGCGTPGGVPPDAEPRQARIVPLRAERPVIALALGSGGSRGFAHIGAIKALEAAGIRPDIVVGSSAGAVVAALYASGLDARRLESLALEVEEGDLIDFSLLDGMRVRGERLADFVRRNVGGRPIERLDRAFAVVATDALTGTMAVFNRGDAGMAVQASSSVPRLFVPPVIGGREYVDGGLSSPVPVRVARAMGASVVIAIDVSRLDQRRARPVPAADGRPPAWSRSARHALLQEELADADVVIRPAVQRTRIIDFDQKAANIAAGEAAGAAALPLVAAAIERARHRARNGAGAGARVPLPAGDGAS